MQSIKSMVEASKKAHLVCYRDGDLWYRTECGFEFPVPVAEAGVAVFHVEEKAILLMRYIRKHVDMLERERVAP